MDSLRAVGIDTRYVLRTDEGRLGLYFLETGANQRPSNVIYDRADSAVAITPAEQYDWEAILADAQWLHLTGITPALSQSAAEATLVAAEKARATGITVSIDLNFRGKLWNWDRTKAPRELAQQTMRTILPSIDVVIANEEDCHDVLGIRAGDTDVHAGAIDTSRYPDVARQVVKQFPNVARLPSPCARAFLHRTTIGARCYTTQHRITPFSAPSGQRRKLSTLRDQEHCRPRGRRAMLSREG